MYEIEKLRIEAADFPLGYLKDTFPELKVSFFRKALDAMARDYLLRSLYGVHGKKKPKRAKERKPEQRRKLEYDRLAPTLNRIKTQVEQLRKQNLPPSEFVAQFKELALALTRDFFECCVQPTIDAKLKALRVSVAKPLELDAHSPVITTILGQYFGALGRDVPLSWLQESYNLSQIETYYDNHSRRIVLEHPVLHNRLDLSAFGRDPAYLTPADIVASLAELGCENGLSCADSQLLFERYLLPMFSGETAAKLKEASASAYAADDFESLVKNALEQGLPKGRTGQIVRLAKRKMSLINLLMHPFVQYDRQGALHAGFAYMVVGLDSEQHRYLPILTLIQLVGAESSELPIAVPGLEFKGGDSLEDVSAQVLAQIGTLLTEAQERSELGQNELELPQSKLNEDEFNQILGAWAQKMSDLRDQRFFYSDDEEVGGADTLELELLTTCFGLNFEHLIAPELLQQARAAAGDACFEPDLSTEEGRSLAAACIYLHPYYKLLFEKLTHQALCILSCYLDLNALNYVVVHSLTAEIRPICAQYLPFAVVVPQYFSELTMFMRYYPEAVTQLDCLYEPVLHSPGLEVVLQWHNEAVTTKARGLSPKLAGYLEQIFMPSLWAYFKRRIKERFDPLVWAGCPALYLIAEPGQLMADTREWLDRIMRPELAHPKYAANVLTYLGNITQEFDSAIVASWFKNPDQIWASTCAIGSKLKYVRKHLGQGRIPLFNKSKLPDVMLARVRIQMSYQAQDEAELCREYQLWQDSFNLCYYQHSNLSEQAFMARLLEIKDALAAGTYPRELPGFDLAVQVHAQVKPNFLNMSALVQEVVDEAVGAAAEDYADGDYDADASHNADATHNANAAHEADIFAQWRAAKVNSAAQADAAAAKGAAAQADAAAAKGAAAQADTAAAKGAAAQADAAAAQVGTAAGGSDAQAKKSIAQSVAAVAQRFVKSASGAQNLFNLDEQAAFEQSRVEVVNERFPQRNAVLRQQVKECVDKIKEQVRAGDYHLTAPDLKYLILDRDDVDSALDKAKLCDEVEYLFGPNITNFQVILALTLVNFAMSMVEGTALDQITSALLRKELSSSAQTQDLETIDAMGFEGNVERQKIMVSAIILSKFKTDAEIDGLMANCMEMLDKRINDEHDRAILQSVKSEHSKTKILFYLKMYLNLSEEQLAEAIELSKCLSEDVTNFQAALDTMAAEKAGQLEQRLCEIVAQLRC